MEEEVKNLIYNISSNPSVNFLRYKPYFLERDVYNICSVIFNIETAIRMGYSVKQVEIEVSKESFNRWNVGEIEKELNELIKLVILINVKIKLICKDTNKGRWNKKLKFKQSKNICLFSGGIDSTTGLIYLLKNLGEDISAVFVCHGDQGKVGNIIQKISTVIKRKYSLNLDVVHAPKMYSEGYSQLRGFLYVMSGIIFANLRGAKNVFITECGPTMYQMRFSPFDSITMTTHPYVMSKTKKLSQLFFSKSFELIIPFEDLTKSEVAITNPLPEIFPIAHSCIGARWIESIQHGNEDAKADNDGTCYGCVTRRLGLITAGVEDAQYEKDPLLDPNAYADHLMNLLAFSTEVILDYDNIDDYSRENIDEFNKQDLFYRFALDNIAALHILIKSGKNLNHNIDHFYFEVVERLGEEILNKRISEVRSKSKKPNLDKKVQIIN